MNLIKIPTFGKWRTASCMYAVARYTHKTKKARVQYIGKTYRDMLLAEKLLVIGFGTALFTYSYPVLLPYSIINDITKIECQINELDMEVMGFYVSNERENWMCFI